MIYEYSCHKCKNVWEEILPMAKMEKPLKNKCPHCDAKVGTVFRYFSSAPSMKMDANYKIDEPHNEGGFQDAMRRLADSPGVKGTKYARKLKEKHIG